MKSIKFLCLSLGIVAVSFVACQDEMAVVGERQSDMHVTEWDGVTYPSSKYFQAMTKSASSFETDWETMNEIPVPTSEGSIYRPWSTDENDSNLPYEFAFDVKKEDGWKMLFHTFNSTSDAMRYIGLYNQRTGVLKVFYYLNNEGFPNNGGAWEMTFTAPQGFLNQVEELSIPVDLGKLENFACTNAVRADNKAFARGWNGFQISLAYAPNDMSDYVLDISSHCLNTVDVSLFSDSYSHSEGTILTAGSSNSLTGLTSNMATVFGKAAEDYLDKDIESGKLTGNAGSSGTRSLVGGIIGAVVNYGVNLIFNSLTSTFSEQTTNRSDLQFSTSGTITTQGDLSFNTNSPTSSTRIQFDKAHVGEVGLWNLADQPTVYVDPRADYVPGPDTGIKGEAYYETRGVSRYDYDLLINPELTPYIKDKWVEIEMVKYYDYMNCAPTVSDMYEYGELGSSGYGFNVKYEKEDLIYGTDRKTGAIYHETLGGYEMLARAANFPNKDIIYPVVYIPNLDMYGVKRFNVHNTFLKMSLYLVTEFEGKETTTISTRTFVPKIEWDPDICEVLENVPLEELPYYEYVK